MQKWEYKTLARARGWSDVKGGDNWHWNSGWDALYEDGKELNTPFETRLSELGKQGWELVAVLPISSILGGQTREFQNRDYAGYTTTEKWVFKRPIE